MNPSDSLHLDEHLARLLAAYDQGFEGADGKAPTLDVPAPQLDEQSTRLQSGPAGRAINEGSLSELFPDQDGTRTFATRPPLPPQETHRIGRFELRRQLGKGGCGIVFLAFDPKLKREVALKIPRPELLMSTDARRRLIREAHAAAGFDHPNLVPVYETGEIGPVCFIATAFCPGQTLADWLDRQAFPVPVRQAARLVAQLAEAVQHAHDRGVLHRDLKPNNVILQETKTDPGDQGQPPGACPLRGDYFIPRVVDFGLAKLSEEGPAETASRQILGTPKYMAPEQAQARHEEVGPRADVYALGVTLYEMLAGRAPYEGETDVDVLRQAVEGNLTPPRDLRPDIPRDLEAIALKAMARLPGKRYRTAIDLADDLRRFLDGLPTLARPLNRVGRAARWLRRHDQWVALAVLSAIALFFLAVGFWNLNQNRQLLIDREKEATQRAERDRGDRRRAYARHVRDAFLSWRAGDARQMAASLGLAGMSGDHIGEPTDFAWGYLSQLGRVEQLSVSCPAGAAVALAVAPAGRWVATGHADGTLAVWDRQTGGLVGSVKAHPGGVTHVAFLPDGAAVVTAGGEPVARLWALGQTGAPTARRVFPSLGAAVTALTVSADGKFILAGSAAGRCACWPATGPAAAKEWAATGGEPVVAVAAAPDGAVLASVGRSEPVRLWDRGKTEPVGEVRGAAGAPALAFIPTGTGSWLLAAAGREDGTVRLFDRQGREVRTLPGHTGAVLALAVSPDGAALVSGGEDEGVCVWDLATGSMRALLRGHDQPVRGVGFGPDGRALVTTSDDGLLKVWDLTADPEGQAVQGLPAAVSGVAIHPDGLGYAAAFADGSVEVAPDRGRAPRRFPADGRGVIDGLQFPAAGSPLGVELAGRSAVVWEFGATPRAILRAEAADGSAVTTAAVSATAGLLAAGDDRGRVAIWSIATRTPQTRFETGLPIPVRHLCFSDDGKWVAAKMTGHALGVWRVGETEPTYKVSGHGDGMWLVRFLPGGGRVVTAGRGSSIKVWDLAAGKAELSLLGHVGRVTGLAVSPDERTLVSGSGTGEVKLWDLRTGQELVGLRRHTGPVTAAEFAGNGRLLLTGGGRGELAFWDAPRE